MGIRSPGSRREGFGIERLTPIHITAIYVVFGLFLLFVSDVVLPAVIADPDLLRGLQGVKGAIEVALTGGLIYGLLGWRERRLRRSERRYGNLIETSPVPINLFDADGTTVWGNDAVLDLLGLADREELVGRSIFEFIHPEDRRTAEGELAAVIEEGESLGPTYMRLRRDDGEVRHIRVSTAPGWYEGERVGQAVVVDVTELREAEEELREERDFIRTALDELRDVFFVVGPDGGLKRWNARLSDVTGYDDELAAMEATDFFPPADRQRVEEAIESALQSGESFVKADLEARDGTRRRYEFKGARLEGAERGVVGIGRDVTERERLERELRENERRYRTLVEMSPDPILVHADGEVVYANDAFVDLVGADEEAEVIGEPITAFLHPEEHEDVMRSSARTQRGEHAPTGNERTVLTAGGEERYVETTSRPIAYEGEPAVLSVVNDVTHRYRYEEMLTALHDRTRAMTRAGGREEIADIAVETVGELLDLDAVVYGFDGGDALVPLSWSDAVAGGEVPAAGKDGGALWEAFVDGEERWIEGGDDGTVGALGLEPALALPVGNHGVLLVGVGGEASLATTRREVLHLIRENANAAFDRAKRERELRERDRRLERQNEALQQLNRLNEIIREINQALVRSTTRAEIGAGVCEEIAAAGQYAFAWIGTRETAEGGVAPEHWKGMDPEYVDHLRSGGPPAPLSDLIDAAFREGTIQVAQGVLDDPAWADGRSDALSYGYRSVAAVPIVRGDRVEGVLVIHAGDPDIFDARERDVLEELGDTIGYALGNVERTEALRTGERTEIEVAIGDERLFTNRIAARTGADVEFVGAIPEGAEALGVFLRLAGADAADVEGDLGALETVTAVEPLSVEDGDGLYRLTIATPPLVEALRAQDARLRALAAEGGTSTLVAVLAGSADVRTVVEAIEGAYSGVELLARREAADPVETRETFRDRLLGELTEKQREALRTAYYGGFYEWPRETTSEGLAGTRGVAPSTFQYHLRAAERKVVGAVLA